MVKKYNLDKVIKGKKKAWKDLTEEERFELLKSGEEALKVVSRLFEKLEKKEVRK